MVVGDRPREGRAAPPAPAAPPVPPGRSTWPKEVRLRRRRDFDLAFARGRRASHPGLLVVARPNGLPHSRFGVSTGRKFGGAPQRNRARRLLREAFRLDRTALPAGYDVVVVPRAGAFPDDLATLRAILATLLARATGAGPERRRGE